MAKTQPKAKGRTTPVAEKPKRERPSRSKATASVALEHKQAMRDTSTAAKPQKLDLSQLTRAEDPSEFPADTASFTSADSPIEASIADNLGVFILDLEYKHYEDDSNAVAQLVRRNAQEASTHSANISLVVTDVTKYTNPPNSGSSAGVIELCDGGKLTEELKYYVNQAIYRFIASVDSRINVTRCVVQRYTLPGIPFII